VPSPKAVYISFSTVDHACIMRGTATFGYRMFGVARPPYRGVTRLNPVAARIAADLSGAGLAAWLWLLLCPGAPAPLAAAAPALAVALLAATGSYRSRLPRLSGGFSPALWLGIAPAVAAPAHAGGGDGVLMPALWLATLLVLALGLGRALLAAALAGRLGRLCAARTVLAGADPAAAGWVQAAGPDHRLIGYVADRPDPAMAAACPATPWLGPPVVLPELVRARRIDQIVLTDPDGADIPLLARLDVRLAVVLPLPHGPRLVPLAQPSLSDAARLLKRAEDIVGAALALAVLGLPMLLIALAIRLDSRGPVLFAQTRTGLNGRPFRMLKFRTMRADAADPHGSRQTSRDDPRLTRIGRLLRRSSADELPQLFNVLRGEMSLIGPRPHALGTRAAGRAFDQVHRDYAARHRLRPGLTGLAQVRGHRGALESEAKLMARTESDLDYVGGWSLWRDLLILARTPWAVLRMRNAY
jgi:lipopolysaccharide/colanic/teichoic acid biosynthesis glycosyltransferase